MSRSLSHPLTSAYNPLHRSAFRVHIRSTSISNHVIFGGVFTPTYFYPVLTSPSETIRKKLVRKGITLFDHENWVDLAHPSRDRHFWGQTIREMSPSCVQIYQRLCDEKHPAVMAGDDARKMAGNARLTYAEVRQITQVARDLMKEHPSVDYYFLSEMPSVSQDHRSDSTVITLRSAPSETVKEIDFRNVSSHFYNLASNQRLPREMKAFHALSTFDVMREDPEKYRGKPIITCGSGLTSAWLQRDTGSEVYVLRRPFDPLIPAVPANMLDVDTTKITYIPMTADRFHLSQEEKQRESKAVTMDYLDESTGRYKSISGPLVVTAGSEYHAELTQVIHPSRLTSLSFFYRAGKTTKATSPNVLPSSMTYNYQLFWSGLDDTPELKSAMRADIEKSHFKLAFRKEMQEALTALEGPEAKPLHLPETFFADCLHALKLNKALLKADQKIQLMMDVYDKGFSHNTGVRGLFTPKSTERKRFMGVAEKIFRNNVTCEEIVSKTRFF